MEMRYKIMITVIFAFLFYACGEDFLDIDSETSLTTSTYFQTDDDFEQAINGAYTPLRELYNGTANQYLGAYIMGEMHSDNARYVYNSSYRATTDPEYCADFIFETDNDVVTAKYQTNYDIIGRANEVLYYIDGITFDDPGLQSNIKGQALFLRAFSYFELVRFFGSIPLHLVPSTSLDDVALELSTAEEVTAQIIADASAAIGLLPEKSEQEDLGRVTRGAARMLLANVYMVDERWSEAEDLLMDVVNSGEYVLLSDYAGIYETSNKNNQESIFEIQYKEGTDGYANYFIYNMLPYPSSAAAIGKLTGVSNAAALAEGEQYNVPTPDLIAAYEEGDTRFAASIDSTYDSNGNKLPYCKKYLHTHTTFGYAGDDWPVYRYAETLLFMAEAINEQGGRSSEALGYLNQVRERAGLADVSVTDPGSLRDIIMHERRIELAFENKRWFDLVRTGKAVDVISVYGARVKANPRAYYFPEGYKPMDAAFSDIKLHFDLPADESQVSPYF